MFICTWPLRIVVTASLARTLLMMESYTLPDGRGNAKGRPRTAVDTQNTKNLFHSGMKGKQCVLASWRMQRGSGVEFVHGNADKPAQHCARLLSSQTVLL